VPISTRARSDAKTWLFGHSSRKAGARHMRTMTISDWVSCTDGVRALTSKRIIRRGAVRAQSRAGASSASQPMASHLLTRWTCTWTEDRVRASKPGGVQRGPTKIMRKVDGSWRICAHRSRFSASVPWSKKGRSHCGQLWTAGKS
jgi:hypothetical protein